MPFVHGFTALAFTRRREGVRPVTPLLKGNSTIPKGTKDMARILCECLGKDPDMLVGGTYEDKPRYQWEEYVGIAGSVLHRWEKLHRS